ncbi:glycoside hydrolase family 31 protein [Aureobasidium subglaciale EXF-2481]|uniref:Glycoside hydrolase family 31 protein n=1 Tax=Aureobasidium subglaciale (strain EXF-2481) TaxID=1043005 RepID=A0A074YPG6_AURSE|nr:glycoside hydrolase family 31 protein [Aureobasidium subglaciale EXF-2481]KAI5210959.1 putative alpha-glucosidase [Aureobasidium subglaciale]KAI5219070.1 putative alpha-glucosidase [Aureobasidium subglaciale]KAI5233228.1 putative alpha-glucosidase [Aureobasidium subglaciale]KAI5260091.1 putative alpha-glucosidase [Aureobasidium subglaciale]KEQ95977.1 glycoside hydrolase family 31 protein [Aureobasidium subglaciale EXF-2481]
MLLKAFYGLALLRSVSGAAVQRRQTTGNIDDCPGYSATNIVNTATGLTAKLTLAGAACNAYGTDIQNLVLAVNYDSEKRLHVKIEDEGKVAYQVPTSVFPTPDSNNSVPSSDATLAFSMEQNPFSFKITRKSNHEVLFDTSKSPIVFEDQYLRLRTALPENPNIFGLGEHSDSLRLNTTNNTRTLWSRDAYGIPSGTNLYGNHPIYFDHRVESGTHGVFLLSSAGMDIKINKTEADGQYLEYDTMGGVIDLYILDGPTPIEVAQEYSSVTQKAAMMPYWGFGFHQCRYGYRDFYAIAEVVANYSASGIPLETMWTDIDYMYERYIMTTDPDRFPLARVREYVNYLHEHNQHYIVMVDPAIAYQTKREYGLPYEAFLRARDQGILLQKNGSIYQGVVWPGVTAFPDWFHPDTAAYWNSEFAEFFDAETGVDIDALWIDMNEAANFNYFNANPQDSAEDRGFPPTRPAIRSAPRPIPGFPAAFQPNASSPYPPDDLAYAPPWLAPASDPGATKRSVDAHNKPTKRSVGLQFSPLDKRQSSARIGFPNRNLLAPPYQIDNENTVEAYGGVSNNTLDTDIVHYDGHVELDVHNLYGTMMSTYSRNALEARRPNRRPMVITRSTFAGAGKAVGKWLGDNLSTWELYRQSIQGMLDFAAIYQVPMVGSDVCGFGGNTTETLCARWASLGAFNPFYRNHNGDSSIPQEFYLWDTVAESARKSIEIRYKLLDYIYTAMHKQSVDGTPLISPMFFQYPHDKATSSLDLQFFYGDALLVAPVTEENSTSVDVYLPNDRFYDFKTYETVEGAGANKSLTNVGFTDIPLYIRGGSIIPMRNASGYTTTDLRKQPFNIVIAPGRDGKASGSLYLDDGDSIKQNATSEITLEYENGVLSVSGCFDYQAEDNRVVQVTLLGQKNHSGGTPQWKQDGDGQEWSKCGDNDWSYDSSTHHLLVQFDQKLTGPFVVSV